MTNTYYVVRGRIWFGPAPTKVAAEAVAGSEAGGTFTNQPPPDGVIVVPWDKLATGAHALTRLPVRTRDSVKVVDPATGQIGWQRAFELGPTGLVVHGKPTLRQWTRYGYQLKRFHEASQWAIGDWINYGESRVDWGDKYTQAINDFGYEYGYLRNIASICGRYDPSQRNDNPQVTFSHHAAAVAVPEPQRQQVLQQAADEGLSVTETQEAVARVTGESIYLKVGTFKGNLQQAVDWMAGQKFARGWDKQIKITLYEVHQP